VKEVLFKFIYLICFINIFCFSENISPSSYNFVFNNYIPNKISKNNIGFKYSFNNKQNYILSQNWISENLYIGGYWGTSNSKEENGKINYSLNAGYKTIFDTLENINVVYDFGIHNKKKFANSKTRWKKMSLLLNYNNFSFSYSYLLAKCSTDDIQDLIENCNNLNDYKHTSFIGIDIYNNLINNVLFINFGIRKSDTLILPHLSLRYNI